MQTVLPINKRSQVFFVLSLLLIVSGCASTGGIKGSTLDTPELSDKQPAKRDVIAELNPDQKDTTPLEALFDDPALPKLEMDAKLLEQLLTLNFSSYAGDWPQAAASATNAAKSSQDYRVARLATLLSLRNNDYALAAEGAQLWLSLAPDNVDAQNMRILSLVGSGNTEGAIKAIESARGDTSIDEHIKQVATLLVRQKNADAGFDVANHLVEQNSESAQVLLSAAYVAELFERYEAAEVWVAKALELRPSWDLAAQMQASLFATQSKSEERAAFIAQFVKDNPNSVAMRINHAGELSKKEKYQEAYDLMSEVLEDAPNDASALQYAGALSEQLKDQAQAGELYRRALRADPSNDNVRWSLARIAVINEEYIKAERLFNEIQSDELAFRAQIQVANMRYETQGVDVAVNTLWVLEPRTNEEWTEVVQTRHYLLMRAHKYEEALGYINEAIIYLPDNIELLYSRALVAAELNEVELAEQDLRVIIERDPKHANAMNALGYTLADQTNRYAEARELIEKALELRPKDAHILDSMGWVSYRLGELETAIEYLQKAYEISPEVEIAAHLGEVLWESGDKSKAKAVWKKSLDEDDSNPVLLKTLRHYNVDFLPEKNSVPSESGDLTPTES